MNLTKNKQSREQIVAMVERAFPETKLSNAKDAVLELTEGLFNVAYRIQLEDGREVVLKIAPAEGVDILFYEKNMMRTEVESLQFVAEHTKVPVPKVYYYDTSKTLCTSEYFFMEKLDGVSFHSVIGNLSEYEKSTIYHEVGRYSAMMNEIEGTYFGYPGIPELQFESMKEMYLKLMDGVLKDGARKQVDLGVDYDYIRQIAQEKSYVLSEVTKPVFVHWDIWEGNVFLKEGKVIGIIDFERALYADPLMEYFFSQGRDSNSYYLEGYGKTEFTENEILRRCLYSIYLYVIMIVECPYRQYENDWQSTWAKDKLLTEIQKLNEICKTD